MYLFNYAFYKYLFTTCSGWGTVGVLKSSRCEPGTDPDPKELEFRGKINHRSTIREAQMICKEVQNKRLLYWASGGARHRISSVELGFKNNEIYHMMGESELAEIGYISSLECRVSPKQRMNTQSGRAGPVMCSAFNYFFSPPSTQPLVIITFLKGRKERVRIPALFSCTPLQRWVHPK